MKSKYRVVRERETYVVYEGEIVKAKGCISKRDALTALWVLNGSHVEDFYEVIDDAGNVVCLRDEV